MNILWYLIVSGGFMTIGLLGSKAQEIKRLKGELARREAEAIYDLSEMEGARVCRFPVR